MSTHIRLQVGKTHYVVDSQHLPPIGAKIIVHKHLDDGGEFPVVEVVSHEWRLEDAPDPDSDGGPVLSVAVKTRVAK